MIFTFLQIDTKVLFLQFDDVDANDKKYKPMRPDQAQRTVDFVKENLDAELCIVHCDAGVSRSAAVAAAIGKFINGDDMFIFGRPRFSPNTHVYACSFRLAAQTLQKVECSGL